MSETTNTTTPRRQTPLQRELAELIQACFPGI